MPRGLPARPGLVCRRGHPPHKGGDRTPVSHRIEMARIAIAGHQAFEVSEIEARRPGPHYSVDTLDAVHCERPGDDLFFLIGADSLVDLPTWRDAAGIARLATIVVVNRPGMDEVDPSIRPSFGPGTKDLLFVTIPSIGIASKFLRQRLAEAPNHPLYGPPRRRSLHRGARAVSRTDYRRVERPGPFGLIGIQHARMMPSRGTPSLSVTTSVDRRGPPSMPRAELGIHGLNR